MTEDTWAERLSEYLDGGLDADERDALERHLAECASCRVELDELRQVVRWLQADPQDAPDPGAWPRVAARIGALPAARPAAARWAGPRRLRLLAGGALAAAAVAVIALPAIRDQAPAPSVPRGPPPAGIALPVSAAPSPSHARAVAELEAVLAEGRGRLSPETIQRLEASLAIVEAAIAQAQQAIAADTANPYVLRHLERLRQEKVETLREAAMIVLTQT
ncbi:MAG TPA: zf-HC2 domain-containing protein [Longimicrobium sp.]|nr:zf-HC2 domain-containing protein [Longimicrobium sp.]